MPAERSTGEADHASVLGGGEGPGGAAGPPAPRRSWGRRTGRCSGSRSSSATGSSRCGAGCVRPTSMTGSRRGRRRRRRRGSRQLEQEDRELRRANAILKSASAFFAAELDRPHRSDGRLHRRASRRVRSRAHLQCVAGGSEHVLRGEVPAGRRRGRSRDAVMMPILMAMWVANCQVYGAHKLWKAARRAGHDIGRDQVARLMRVSWASRGEPPAAQGPHHPAGPGRRRGRRISSTGTSPRRARTSCGSPT